MQARIGNHRQLLAFLIVGLLVAAGGARADEIDRIREKVAELDRALVAQNFEYAAEGKESNLARVYKDFGYLLQDSKSKALADAAAATNDPAAKERLERMYRYLVGERIISAVATGWDNARNYDRSAAMTVAGSDVELTLNSYEPMLANEENRTNRRNWYLASRELRENSNVFLLNLAIDLDRQAQQIAGKDYDTFLAEQYEIDPAELETLALQVLESTRAEYERLLSSVVPAAIPEMTASELREYDIPHLLRMPHLDEVFLDGKPEETAARWLADMGIDLGKARNLRIVREARPGRSPEPATFPVENGADTRVSIPELGGFPDYWNLFGQLGSALFYYHIDPKLELADRRIGSPVLPFLYGALFQNVLTIPEWRREYLPGGDPGQVGDAIAFRNLLDLRDSAARYLFYRKIYANPETPPSAYAEAMQSARLWHQGATEESNYLLSDDRHQSGMKLLAAVRAAQLQARLAEQFGDAWWSNPQAGAWLKSEWGKGFQHSPRDLASTWGLGAPDASALARGEVPSLESSETETP
jgi:hypothetical protein